MRTPIALAAVAAILLTAAAPATGQPNEPPVREFGNGPERNQQEAVANELVQALRAPEPATGIRTDRGYPRQTVLPVPAPNPDDASIKLGLVPYHEIAPRLNALQRRSDRVSVEIVGQSQLGRDLYLVTVTEPESKAQAPPRGARPPLS